MYHMEMETASTVVGGYCIFIFTLMVEVGGGGERQPLAVFLYVSGVNKWIRKACEKYNLKAIFKSGLTLRSLFTKV